VLRDWWQRTSALEMRRTALLAIAMLRFAEAHDFLLSLVAAAPGHDARDAIAALRSQRWRSSATTRHSGSG
jgi:hypothetical protein